MRIARPTRLKMQLARDLRRRQTNAEREAWNILRSRRCLVVTFRCQHPIRGFIVDFYAPELGLVLGIDGGVHRTERRRAAGKVRDRVLLEQGLVVARIPNSRVTRPHLEAIIAGHLRPPPLREAERGEGG